MKLHTAPPTDPLYTDVVNTADYSIYILTKGIMIEGNIINLDAHFVKHTRKATKRKMKQALKRWIIGALRTYIKQSKSEQSIGVSLDIEGASV